MLANVLLSVVTILCSGDPHQTVSAPPRDPRHTAPAQPRGAILVSVDGVKRAQTEIRINAPKDPAKLRAPSMLFGGRKGVRTDDGKVVNGMGFDSWRQGQDIVVAVFVLVPNDHQPNTNITDDKALLELSHRYLKTYVLKGAEPLEVLEAASLGYGRTIVEVVQPKGHPALTFPSVAQAPLPHRAAGAVPPSLRTRAGRF